MTPAWAARLAYLIPSLTGEELVAQLEMHLRQRRAGLITVYLDCDHQGECREGRVHPAPIVGRKVTAVSS